MVALCAFVMSGCAPARPPVPQNVTISQQLPASWPTPLPEVHGVPRILAMRFSSLDFPIGSDWSGDFVTSTNTASIEVIGTNLFSFSVPSAGVGRFHFDLHTIDVPPFFIRSYLLRLIARDGAGVPNEVDLPFRIRGREQ